MKNVSSALRYSYDLEENEDDFGLVGDPDGEPFAVTIREKGWIPVNLIIFAQTKEDAENRVIAQIAHVANVGHRTYSAERANKYLGMIRDGKLTVEPYDKRNVSKIGWASNDTIY